MTGIAVVLAALALVPSKSSSAVIVVANPFGSENNAATIVARAQGALLRGGKNERVLIAHNDGPAFVGRLYAFGALLVLDAGVLQGCGIGLQ